MRTTDIPAGSRVNKTRLIEHIATRTGLNREAAAAALDAALDTITQTMAGGGEVNVTNFGTFRGVHADERKARNPQTGEVVTVPSGLLPRFRTSITLAASVRAENTRATIRKASSRPAA
ncbi:MULTISPECIES: HU family DNA-binding protein [unclassified Streptomyces]|uniref:HU family DNA-binding protein n=1 Tax=unclassified Streptomyces TaxID=2593676 RepID=UPI003436DE83